MATTHYPLPTQSISHIETRNCLCHRHRLAVHNVICFAASCSSMCKIEIAFLPYSNAMALRREVPFMAPRSCVFEYVCMCCVCVQCAQHKHRYCIANRCENYILLEEAARFSCLVVDYIGNVIAGAIFKRVSRWYRLQRPLQPHHKSK